VQKYKKKLLNDLYDRDGHICQYCGIKEKDFPDLWGEFYGLPYRGKRLEIDRKDAVSIQGGEIKKTNPEYSTDNCVLACALCNMSKSNMFTHEEFHEVSKVIQDIWKKRKQMGLN